MMRIGLITGEYPPLQGGVSNHVAMLAQYLLQHGHHPYIFSNDRAQQQHPEIPVANNITKWNYATIRKIDKWSHDNQLDILNMHFQTAAYDMSAWVHFMPQLLSRPFVTTFHDLRFPYLFPKAGKLRDWIVMHLAKISDSVIVTNHEDYQRIAHLPSAMIPIGSSIERVDTVDCDAIRRDLNIADDEFLLAHFGFINHSKGIDTLLHALSSLDDPKIKLLMIGGRTGTADPTNKTYADTIDDLISGLGLNDQIIWTGFVTNQEVGQYLRVADALTLPFRDGASFRRSSLMAAIEQNCAIITTQPNVSIPEFTPENMIQVEPENIQQLATAICDLQTSPSRRESLRNGAKQLRQRFDWDVITRQNIEFFQKTLEQRS